MKLLSLVFIFLLAGLTAEAKQYYCSVRTAPCEKYSRAEDISVFVFKHTQRIEVLINRGRYEHGSTISTGLKIHGGTPEGIFYPTSRIERTRNHCSRNTEYASRSGRLAPMPYAIHFHKGYAIHAGRVTGRPASHGCVRMNEPDARNLYCLLTSQENWKRTMIVIQD